MAVYTDVSDGALRAFLSEYQIGDLTAFRGIAEGVENSNFVLRTTGGDFILTLYERRVDPGDLPWFLGLMGYLSDHGLSCPRPVPARDGAALRTLAGRPAAVTTFLSGVWPRQVLPAHCAPVGAALATLHAAGRGYDAVRPNALGPAAWPALVAACRADGDSFQPGLMAELDAALADILPAWPGQGGHADLPRGQIHADLFPDNVFFLDGGVSGIIDFYFACTDLLAYDIAICLNAWCFDADGSFDVAKSRALIAGYESVRPLSAAERRALPVLASGAALRFLLTRLYDWLNTPAGAMVTRKDPLDYLRRLRFHRAVRDGGAAYGL
ncbi:homoserine kinase [Gluconacetobacter azotocaptans]|uniref:Homoserine kinase n=1 Tax=Gluconacetobacter azotocaptans TaxID=142834 RepID=A0A7W4JT96_9PROT|nr:homoserine kinase [Gluconacetobacter azotocaptans]MBB2190487.1 homoserine kinase [Gluconacetobacter azotocaptans]GBQ29414.1 homoserine kinase [Gluconacetobacter azotocaptans DSM 13594]